LPFHTTATEHFEKLQRVAKRLQNEAVHVDALDDFFKTAYHLIENIEKDPATSAAQKAQATALRSDPDIKLCREITNRQKHVTLKATSHPDPKIQGNATIQQGWGVGRWGVGAWSEGEPSVSLTFTDGTTCNVLDLVHAVVGKITPLFAP
jgi:hypothetical protein